LKVALRLIDYRKEMEEIKNLQKIKEMASYCKFYFYEVFVFTYMKKKNISTLFAA